MNKSPKHRAAPAVVWTGHVKDVTFRPRVRSSKYEDIAEAIRKLAINKAIAFKPTNGEDLTALKARVATMVSRSCLPPEGARYRTRLSKDGCVIVSLDKIKKDVDE